MEGRSGRTDVNSQAPRRGEEGCQCQVQAGLLKLNKRWVPACERATT